MKYLLLLLCLLFTVFIILCIHPGIVSKTFTTQNTVALVKDTITNKTRLSNLQNTLAHVSEANHYALQRHFNTSFCLLADMSITSGKNRLFLYSFSQQKILYAALVAHGSCNYAFLMQAKFSNEPGCGCTAYGKYKIGGKYNGRFGVAYKLYGLDSSNSNAFARNIVLHSYNRVPEEEVYPMPVCNSLGCIMVSSGFLKTLSAKIDSSSKPVLLCIFY